MLRPVPQEQRETVMTDLPALPISPTDQNVDPRLDQQRAHRPDLPPVLPEYGAWWEVFKIAFMVAALYTLVNLASARAIVEGKSMSPAFADRQLVIVSRLSYFFGKPQRGDVIVLHNPTNPSEDYIKRVIGLPGETVRITDGIVYIDNKALDEPYITPVNRCSTICDGRWQVAVGEYFVLGDNRADSRDSHVFGAFSQQLIVGMAWLRYYPLDQIALIDHPRY